MVESNEIIKKIHAAELKKDLTKMEAMNTLLKKTGIDEQVATITIDTVD